MINKLVRTPHSARPSYFTDSSLSPGLNRIFSWLFPESFPRVLDTLCCRHVTTATMQSC